jgi:hypothetical protein
VTRNRTRLLLATCSVAAATTCSGQVLAGKAANEPPKPSQPSQPLYVQLIDKFSAKPGCDRDIFNLAKSVINVEVVIAQTKLDTLRIKSESRSRYIEDIPYAIEAVQVAVSEFNDLAYAAQKKGCLTMARDLYLEVIERFIGSSFEAMRQRAQIGLDDIREAQRWPTVDKAPDAIRVEPWLNEIRP